MEWILGPYRRYNDFSGRSGRREFWLFTLFLSVVSTILLLAAFLQLVVEVKSAVFGLLVWVMLGQISILSVLHPYAKVALAAFLLLSVVTFVPSLALHIRRLHDQNRSGWWILLFLIPRIGSLILLVMMALPGTQGPNRFGSEFGTAEL